MASRLSSRRRRGSNSASPSSIRRRRGAEAFRATSPRPRRYRHAYYVLDPRVCEITRDELERWTRARSPTLLVHVPRTSGTTLRALYAALLPAADLQGARHYTAAQMRSCDRAGFDQRPSLAVVRDPWARAVSAFDHLVRIQDTSEFDSDRYFGTWLGLFDDFSHFVESGGLDVAAKMCAHFLPALDWLFDPRTGDVLVTHTYPRPRRKSSVSDRPRLSTNVHVVAAAESKAGPICPSESKAGPIRPSERCRPRASDRRGRRGSEPRRSREPSPRNIHVVAAAESKAGSVDTPSPRYRYEKLHARHGNRTSMAGPLFATGLGSVAVRRNTSADYVSPPPAATKNKHCARYTARAASIVARVYADDARAFGYGLTCASFLPRRVFRAGPVPEVAAEPPSLVLARARAADGLAREREEATRSSGGAIRPRPVLEKRRGEPQVRPRRSAAAGSATGLVL